MADMEQLRKNLEARGFQTSHFPTGAAACAYLNRELNGRTIGFGGSQTVRDMGLYEQLSQHNDCIWHWDKARNVIPKDATDAQVYICSVNGLAETGEMVNIDGGGNRAASGLFGHDKVYFIVGSNKIAADLEGAIWRARNIAGPKNARRLGKKTPCAVNADRCYDCKSPERICAAMVIYWEKPALIPEVEVVLVDEPLGF
jgi:NAD-dependent dihydropyrimidine dehydrogenase PreA subunit